MRYVNNLTGFSGQKFYTLILITIKQCKYINLRNLGHFLIKFDWIVKFQPFQSKITFGVCKFCSSTCCFPEKPTQLAQILHDHQSTNLNSACISLFTLCWNEQYKIMPLNRKSRKTVFTKKKWVSLSAGYIAWVTSSTWAVPLARERWVGAASKIPNLSSGIIGQTVWQHEKQISLLLSHGRRGKFTHNTKRINFDLKKKNQGCFPNTTTSQCVKIWQAGLGCCIEALIVQPASDLEVGRVFETQEACKVEVSKLMCYM